MQSSREARLRQRFLLAQIGAHAAARFAERLSALEITPAHAGLLRVIAASAGASQQQVALTLGMFASRMVALVDELQERKLVERLSNPEDRRTYSLALTAKAGVFSRPSAVSRANTRRTCSVPSARQNAIRSLSCCSVSQTNKVSCAVSIRGLPAWEAADRQRRRRSSR